MKIIADNYEWIVNFWTPIITATIALIGLYYSIKNNITLSNSLKDKERELQAKQLLAKYNSDQIVLMRKDYALVCERYQIFSTLTGRIINNYMRDKILSDQDLEQEIILIDVELSKLYSQANLLSTYFSPLMQRGSEGNADTLFKDSINNLLRACNDLTLHISQVNDVEQVIIKMSDDNERKMDNVEYLVLLSSQCDEQYSMLNTVAALRFNTDIQKVKKDLGLIDTLDEDMGIEPFRED